MDFWAKSGIPTIFLPPETSGRTASQCCHPRVWRRSWSWRPTITRPSRISPPLRWLVIDDWMHHLSILRNISSWEIFQSFPHIRVVRPSYAYHCCQFMPSTYENLVNTIFIINIFAVVVELTLASWQLSLSKILQNYNPAHSVIRFPSTQTLVTYEKTSSSQGSSTSANSATRPCLASSGRHQVSWGWWWWWWRWWWYWWWLGWSVESTTNDLMITTRQLKHRTGHRSLNGPLGELCLRDVGGLPKYRRVRRQRWCQVSTTSMKTKMANR